jgi:hypothetical protein
MVRFVSVLQIDFADGRILQHHDQMDPSQILLPMPIRVTALLTVLVHEKPVHIHKISESFKNSR